MGSYQTRLKIDAPVASVVPTFVRAAKSLEWKVESDAGDLVSVREPYSVALWRSWPVSIEAAFDAADGGQTKIAYSASMTGLGPLVGAILKKTVTAFHEKVGMLAGDAALEAAVDARADRRRSAVKSVAVGVGLWVTGAIWTFFLLIADAPSAVFLTTLAATACSVLFVLRGYWRWLAN